MRSLYVIRSLLVRVVHESMIWRDSTFFKGSMIYCTLKMCRAKMDQLCIVHGLEIKIMLPTFGFKHYIYFKFKVLGSGLYPTYHYTSRCIVDIQRLKSFQNFGSGVRVSDVPMTQLSIDKWALGLLVHRQMSPGPPCPWAKEPWASLFIDRGTLGPVASLTAGLGCPLQTIWRLVDKGGN